MKGIVCEIEAQVTFRFNNQNEKRMSNELLSSIQAVINKKSPTLSTIINIQDVINLSIFLANTTSHDNPFNESIEDLELAWEKLNNLIESFECDKCQKLVSVKCYDSVLKKIRCRCGNLQYDWKK